MRPGPLNEIPLEGIVETITPISTPRNTDIISCKRPLSPGEHRLCAPAKRRILAVEGILSPKSSKPPLSFVNGATSASRIHELLNGPDSPARRLDFGVAKSGCVDSENIHVVSTKSRTLATSGSRDLTPLRRAIRTPLTSSSTSSLGLASGASSFVTTPSSNRAHSEMGTDDYFSPKKGLVTSLPREVMGSHSIPDSSDFVTHYPGFDVFIDTNDCPTEGAEEKVESFMGRSKATRDSNKENIPPLRERCSNPSALDPFCQTAEGKVGHPPLPKAVEVEGCDPTPHTISQINEIERSSTLKQASQNHLPAPIAIPGT